MTDLSDDVAILKEFRRELEALRREAAILRAHKGPDLELLNGIGFDLSNVDLRRVALGDDVLRRYAIEQIEKRTDALERRIGEFEARWIPQGPLN